jgi:1-acyl-sn-glycerol-3-phosphate acyltransferase
MRPLCVPVRILLCSVGYVAYWIGGMLFTATVLPTSLLLVPFGLQKRYVSGAMRHSLFLLTRILLPALQIYRVRPPGSFGSQSGGTPAVYVANHRGRLDGLLLLAHLRNTGVVMKSTYARRPMFALFGIAADFVSVDAHSPGELSVARERCLGILKAGRNLLVFPEGTRTVSTRMLPFRSFAFRLAVEAACPVVPLVIHSDSPFMTKELGSYFPLSKFTYRLSRLEPVVPGDEERAEEFAERVRHMMSAELERLAATDGDR